MKYIFIAILLLASISSFAQVTISQADAIQAEEAYKNIHRVSLYSDENSSVFVIFVKEKARMHYHLNHTEIVTVLEGTGEFYLAGDKMTIKKGDHIVIPPGVPHGVVTTSGKPLKVISVQSPEFLGKDVVFLEEEKKTGDDKKTTDKSGDDEEEDDIPEYD